MELRSFPSPPEGVRNVMDAVNALLGEPQGWDTAKKVLGKQGFLKGLE